MNKENICYNCKYCHYDSCGDGYCEIHQNIKIIDDNGCHICSCLIKKERNENDEK